MSLFRWGTKKLLTMGQPAIFSGRCVRSLSPLASCTLCRDICPVKGIDFSFGEPIINDCTGCGMCVRTCPQNVFEMDLPKIFKRIADYNRIIIGCKNDPHSDVVDIRISCLQQLKPEDVLILADAVDEIILFADKSSCNMCINNFFPEAILIPLESFSFPIVKRIKVFRNEQDLKSYIEKKQMDRRSFMKYSVHELMRAGEDVTGSELINWLQNRNMYEAKVPLASRSRLLPLYKKYNEYIDPEVSLAYPMLHATECVYCGACSMMCPQDALVLIEEEGTCALKFSPALCSKCDLCLDVCRINGLVWQNELTNSDFLTPQWETIHSAKRKQCSSCGQYCYSNSPEEPLCPICYEEESRKNK